MTALLEVLEMVGVASTYVFWLPLLAWTLVWLAAEGGLRTCRGAHPAVRYRITQAVLLALPLGLLLASSVDLSALLPRQAPTLLFVPDLPLPSASPAVQDFIPTESAAPARVLTLWALLGFGTCVAALLAVVRLLRLGTHAMALRRLRCSLSTVQVPGLEDEARAVAKRLGMRRLVKVVATDAEVVPMTFGARRPLVVLPAALAPESRRLALAHEFVHVRHHDYSAQWLEALVAAVFAVHPAVHRLRRRCDLLREMTCDAALLAAPGISRHSYASLVCAFVTPPAPAHPFTVGMADSTSHVNQRLRAMQTYRPAPGYSPHRASWLLAAVVLVCGGLTVTAAQGIAQPAPTITVRSAGGSQASPLLIVDGGQGGAADTTVFVVVEEPAEPIGGTEGVQRRLRYPEAARRAGVEGTAFIQFIVEEDGSVTDPVCVRDPGAGLCESAIAAIRDTEFTPGRQRGGAVRTRMSLPIRFRLGEGAEHEEPLAAPSGFHAQIVSVEIEREEDGSPIAQVLRGIVLNGDDAVPGANIVVESDGPPAGAASGPDGRFVLRVPLDEELQTRRVVFTHPTFGRGELNPSMSFTRTALPNGGELNRYSTAPDRLEASASQARSAPEFAVHSAHPNPSTGEVAVTFNLPAAAEVQVEVFDVAGRRVHAAQPARMVAGAWQSLRIDGAGLAAGTYTYRLQARAADQVYTGSGTFTIVR